MTNRLIPTVLAFVLLSACSGEKTATEYLDSAIEYKDAGRIPAALIEGRNSVKLDPDNPAARVLIGEMELLTGDPQSSEKELLKALELGISEPEIIPMLSQAYVQQGKYVELLNLSTDKLSPTDAARVLANKAQAHLQLQNPDMARQLATEALAADPSSPAGLTISAQLQALNNNLPVARTLVSKALDSSQDYSEAWELLGDIDTAEKRFDEAVVAYTKAADSAANRLPAVIKRAQTNLRLQKYTSVREDLTLLKQSGVKLPLVHLMKTEILFSEGKFLDAQTELEQALKLNPDSIPVVRSLALTHFLLGNLGQADQYAKQYQNAINSVDSRVLLAAIRLQQDRLLQAVEILQPLADTERLDALGSRVLATIYLKQNDIDKAVTTMLNSHTKMRQDDNSIAPDLAFMEAPSIVLVNEFLNLPSDSIESTEQDYLTNSQQLLVNAVGHLTRGQTEQAMSELQSLTTAEPESAALLGLAGRIQLASGDHQAARQSFEQAVEISPSPDSSTIMLTLLELNAGDLESARALLSNALEKSSPGSRSEVLLSLAGLEDSTGDTAAKLTWLNQAVDENPRAYLPSVALAVHYTQQSEHAKVIETLSSLAEGSYRTERTMSLLIQAHIELEEIDRAVELLSPMINQRPDSAIWRYLLARAYAANNDHVKTNTELDAALRIDPDHVPSLLAKAAYNIENNNVHEAGRQLAQLQEIMPDAPELIALRKKMEDQASNNTSSEAPVALENTTTVLDKARALWAENKQDEALLLMTEWLEENPEDLTMMLSLGNTYNLSGRENEAIEMFEKALLNAPDNFIALNNLAWQLRDLDPQAAVKHAEASLLQQPDNLATLDTLAVIHFGMGNLTEAEEAFRKIQSLGATDPTILFHGARIEAALGNAAEAKAILQPLVTGSSEFPEAGEARTLYDEL